MSSNVTLSSKVAEMRCQLSTLLFQPPNFGPLCSRLGLNCLFGRFNTRQTPLVVCVILGFSPPNISAIAKFDWQVSDSHTWEIEKLSTPILSKFTFLHKLTTPKCANCQSGSAASLWFSVQLTFNGPKVMYQGAVNRAMEPNSITLQIYNPIRSSRAGSKIQGPWIYLFLTKMLQRALMKFSY